MRYLSPRMLVRSGKHAGGRLMDKYTLYAAQFLGFKEYFLPKGHNACKGCGVALAVRHVYKALEGKGAQIEKATWHIPWSPYSFSEITSRAVRPTLSLLAITKTKTNESKSDSFMICFDNETSEQGADTTNLIKKFPSVAAASGYSYVATACPSYPFDLVEKIRTGWEREGSAYIHILCPCPVAWGVDPQNSVRIGRMAVESRIFPLYEIVGGYYRITCDEPNPRPIKEYIKAQKRFGSWNAKKIESLELEATAAYNTLIERCRKNMA